MAERTKWVVTWVFYAMGLEGGQSVPRRMEFSDEAEA